MERYWTDPRNGKTWHVRAYNSGPAMATAGQIPDAGEDMIEFRYPNKHSPTEGYATKNPGLRDPSEMTDRELQDLLDRARAEQ